jgi:hypothetical protein
MFMKYAVTFSVSAYTTVFVDAETDEDAVMVAREKELVDCKLEDIALEECISVLEYCDQQI